MDYSVRVSGLAVYFPIKYGTLLRVLRSLLSVKRGPIWLPFSFRGE